MKILIEDVFFLSLRVTLGLFLVKVLGLVVGVSILIAIRQVTYYFMYYVMRLDGLSAMDELFVLDDEKNLAYIVSK
jgi:hypothetical protein